MHANIPDIIQYFLIVIFSFSINLEARIVITIELEVITDTIDTCPSNKLNLWNKFAPKSNIECSIKYPLKLIFKRFKFFQLLVNKQYKITNIIPIKP